MYLYGKYAMNFIIVPFVVNVKTAFIVDFTEKGYMSPDSDLPCPHMRVYPKVSGLS
jgi:hypothetical protein